MARGGSVKVFSRWILKLSWSCLCTLAGDTLARNVPPLQEDTSSSNINFKFPSNAANTYISARPVPRHFDYPSLPRSPHHGGPQEEGQICWRCIRVWSQLQRSGRRCSSTSCAGLWSACSSWIHTSYGAWLRSTFTRLWSSHARLWCSARAGLRTTSSPRPECAEPAVWSDELGCPARASCAAASTAHGSSTTKPIVPLGPHCSAIPRLGALQPSSCDQPALQRGRNPLRVRERVEQIPSVHTEHHSNQPLAVEEVKAATCARHLSICILTRFRG